MHDPDLQISHTVDLRSLHAFCLVAEHGSLTRAAAAAGETQSSLSRRIAAFEAEIQGRLFVRTGRGVALTELGERMTPRARTILADLESMLGDGRGEKDTPAGVVDVAVVPAVARPLITELCVWITRHQPRIQLRAREAYSGDVEEQLATGRIDIGIFNRYGRGSVRDAELLLQSDMSLVLARGTHGLPKRRDVPFKMLRGLPLIVQTRPNALTSKLSDLAAAQGFALTIACEMGSGSLIQDALGQVAAGTVAPSQVVTRDFPPPRFDAWRLVTPTLRQKTWMAISTQRPSGPATRAVFQALRLISSRGERRA